MRQQRSYGLDEQLAIGEEGAAELDAFFSARYWVERAGFEMDRAGIDRIFTHLVSGKCYSVEYKSDGKAASTGNAFIELVSDDVEGRPGWAKTCLAQWLVYYLPPKRQGYLIRTCAIKARLEKWANKYPLGHCQNKGYSSTGILVKLWELESIAYARKSFVIPP